MTAGWLQRSMGSSTMTTPSAREHYLKLCRAGLALTLAPFLAGWSPPVSVLGSPLYMFFGDPDRGDPDLRPLEMTPNDVATACVRYPQRHGLLPTGRRLSGVFPDLLDSSP